MCLQDAHTKEDGTLGDSMAGKYKVKEEATVVAHIYFHCSELIPNSWGLGRSNEMTWLSMQFWQPS